MVFRDLCFKSRQRAHAFRHCILLEPMLNQIDAWDENLGKSAFYLALFVPWTGTYACRKRFIDA